MSDSEQFNLFADSKETSNDSRNAAPARRPLAARMRPRRLDEVLGQSHILREHGLLRKLIHTDRFGSLLFYGPPGSGKTSLAAVIANETKGKFLRINAVQSNVAELRNVLQAARSRPELKTILFIDEIHRFNKAQQDLLLPDVEEGYVRLIGATTHNPGFYVIAPLVSRSHLFRLEPLKEEDVVEALERALSDSERGLGDRRCKSSKKVLAGLAKLSDGDLRRALNALEVLVEGLSDGSQIESEHLRAFAAERQIRYDADEDEHYDTISAFIKSIRGGDPDAALYWLAKMLAGGEDPRFIARRLVILASEDIGLANSHALPLAVATHHACDFVGLPECELNLAHSTVFLATSPKSNSTTEALGKAKREIREKPVQQTPPHLRDSHSSSSREAGHGKGYLYSHEFPEAISGQEYLERPVRFYQPGQNGAEKSVAERLERWRLLKKDRKSNI